MATVNHLLYIAKLAEETQRYEDMLQAITSLIRIHPPTAYHQKHLFAFACKTVLNKRKLALKKITYLIAKEEAKGSQFIALALRHKIEIEAQIYKYCKQIIQLVDTHLLNVDGGVEFSVFCLKMKADYYKCIVQYANINNNRAQFIDKCKQAYEYALTLAESISKMKPIRYELAHHFSVFCYQVLNDVKRACLIARSAFTCGISQFCHVPIEEEDYKESIYLMQMIRDNLNLWSQTEGESQ